MGRFLEAGDFFVEEVPAYAATGEGGHTFVFVEKTMMNTEDVAGVLARAAGVAVRDVGYAGRKDRRAVTRQWLSVPGLAPEGALAIDAPGMRVLSAARHPHKLRTGHLSANRFVLRVRDLDGAVLERLGEARDRLVRVGLPNRFGEQRFGRDGENVERARRLLAGGPVGRDRRKARFALSALQSLVFNAVLAERPLSLDRVECGDLARRVDSGGLFVVEDAEAENLRAARFEISATGPIFGTRMEQPGGAVAERERAVVERHGVDPTALSAPRGIRLRGARRPLRVPIADLEFDRCEGAAGEQDLRLRFTLPPGSYATVVLEELLGSVPSRGGGVPA